MTYLNFLWNPINLMFDCKLVQGRIFCTLCMKDGLGSFWEVASWNVRILKGVKRAKNSLFLPILMRF